MVRGLETVLDGPDFKNLEQDGRDPRRGFLSSFPATERNFNHQLGWIAGGVYSSSRGGLLCSRRLRRINTGMTGMVRRWNAVQRTGQRGISISL